MQYWEKPPWPPLDQAKEFFAENFLVMHVFEAEFPKE